jgi:hypothetical protein
MNSYLRPTTADSTVENTVSPSQITVPALAYLIAEQSFQSASSSPSINLNHQSSPEHDSHHLFQASYSRNPRSGFWSRWHPLSSQKAGTCDTCCVAIANNSPKFSVLSFCELMGNEASEYYAVLKKKIWDFVCASPGLLVSGNEDAKCAKEERLTNRVASTTPPGRRVCRSVA